MSAPSYADVLAAAEQDDRDDAAAIRAWPAPLESTAFRGVAGDIVRLWQPHTEADDAAVLVHLLVFFGNAAGRFPHAMAGGDRHGLNEYALVLGPTSAGRKGTSSSIARTHFRLADPTWENRQILSGLSSGEGLIHMVRDPEPRIGERAADPGSEDKRVCVLESEFASALKVMSREGNTLSANLRRGWDGHTLNTMTRTAPIRATGAHISLIGHITPDELQKTMDKNEAANGLLNRFKIIAAKRSKVLPEPGAPEQRHIEELSHRLERSLGLARQTGEMVRDNEARELWRAVYETLSAERAGLLGKALSRAAPHVLRLSCIYALLDGSQIVRRVDLEAALAFWRYVEDSTAFFLGDMLEDPTADAILRALRERADGMTRTEMYKMNSGHLTKHEVQRALAYLVRNGLAFCEEKGAEAKKGRPAERWMAAKYAKEAKEVVPVVPTEVVLSLISPNSQFSEGGIQAQSVVGTAKEANFANQPPIEAKHPCPGGCGKMFRGQIRHPCEECRTRESQRKTADGTAGAA